MTRQETINELKQLLDAYIESINPPGWWNHEDYVNYLMEIAPKEPEEPKEPREPKNANDRFLTEMPEMTFKEYKKTHHSNRTKAPFHVETWQWIIIGICVAVFAFWLILGIVVKNSKNEYNPEIPLVRGQAIINTCFIPIVIAVAVFLVSIFRFIVELIKNASSDDFWLRREYENYNNKRKEVGDYLAKKNKAISDYEKYEKRCVQYKIDKADYTKRLGDYKRAYGRAKIKAEKVMKEHNDKAEKDAADKLEKVKASLQIEYPEKYYNELDKIIAIIEDMRADTIKEAINVYVEDHHREMMLNEQSRLADAQEEQNRELERQGREQEAAERQRRNEEQMRYNQQMEYQRQKDAEERRRYDQQQAREREQEERQQAEARRQKLEQESRAERVRARCMMCKHYGGCSLRFSITDVCPNFIGK